MNKIYRIIWSKARNCYVVVSEIAKRSGKCSSSLNKKLIAAFLAAGTVLSVSGSAWADPLDDKYIQINSTGVAASAAGADAIAIGEDASAAGDYATAVGFGAFAGLTDTSMGLMQNATAIGANSYSDGEGALAVGTGAYTKGRHAITIGDSAHDDGNNKDRGAFGENAIAIGHQASAKGYNTIAIGGSTVTGTKESSVQGATVLGSGAWGTKDYVTAVGNRAQALGSYSVANGAFSGANDYSVAIGGMSAAGVSIDPKTFIATPLEGKIYTSAVGLYSAATGWGSTALGSYSQATNTYSTAVGMSSKATAMGGVALGSTSVADTEAGTTTKTSGYDPTTGGRSSKENATWRSTKGAVSVGSGGTDTRQITNVAAGYEPTDAVNVAQLQAAVSAGGVHYYSVNADPEVQDNYDNKGATGANALAAGVKAKAENTASTAVGYNAHAIGGTALALGTSVTATGNQSVAIGTSANAEKDSSIAIGTSVSAKGTNSIAIGTGVTAEGQGAIALGSYGASAKGDGSMAFGVGSTAEGNYSTAFGAGGAKAKGTGATAFGVGSTAEGNYSTAFGAGGATASGTGATAFGTGSRASGANSTAFGVGSMALGVNSTAWGSGIAGTSETIVNFQGLRGFTRTGSTEYNIVNSGILNKNTSEQTWTLTDSETGEVIQSGTLDQRGNLILSDSDKLIKNTSSNTFTIENKDGEIVARGNLYTSGIHKGEIDPSTLKCVDYNKQHIFVYENADTSPHDTHATAFGNKTRATAYAATAWGTETKASGSESTSWGVHTVASAAQSTAFGAGTEASGVQSTAWGTGAKATQVAATAFGQSTEANSVSSTAWGLKSKANGVNSTAFGDSSEAIGYAATAFGQTTKATGVLATTWGELTRTFGFSYNPVHWNIDEPLRASKQWITRDNVTYEAYNLTAPDGTKVATAIRMPSQYGMDYFNIEYDPNYTGTKTVGYTWGGNDGTAFGTGTQASGVHSTAFGSGTIAFNNESTAFGKNTIARGDTSTAFGEGTIAYGTTTLAFGNHTKASGQAATSFGIYTSANDIASTAFGTNTIAAGTYSTAFGRRTRALNIDATAFGEDTLATGSFSTSFGRRTAALDNLSTAWGDGSVSYGVTSTTFGSYSSAIGANSVSWGVNTAAGKITYDGKNVLLRQISNEWSNDPTKLYFEIRDHENPDTILKTVAVDKEDYSSQGGKIKDELMSAGVTLEGGFAATAFGVNAIAAGEMSAAFGTGTTASGGASTAFGQNTKATNWVDTAFGQNTTASGGASTAFGAGTSASAWGATAFGQETKATAWVATAFGANSVARGSASTAFGLMSNANGENSLAALGGTAGEGGTWNYEDGSYGGEWTVKPEDEDAELRMGNSSVAIGQNAVAKPNYTYAIGQTAQALSKNSIAIGNGATVASDWSSGSEVKNENGVAFGSQTSVYADNGAVFGYDSSVSSKNGIAVGHNAYVGANWSTGEKVDTENGIAIGNNVGTYATNALTIGNDSEVTGEKSIAIGYGNTVRGKSSSVIGDPNEISGDNNIIHANNVNDGGVSNLVVVGHHDEGNTHTYLENSVALGANAYMTEIGGMTELNISGKTYKFAGIPSEDNGTVSIGSADKERTITNLAPGRISDTSTDAINGSQLHAVIDAMQFDIVAGDNVEVIKSKDEDSGHTVYTIHSLNAIVQPGTNNTVTVDGEVGEGDTNGKTTDLTSAGDGTTEGGGADAGTNGGTTATTPDPTPSEKAIVPSENPHTTTYTVDAADSKVKDVAVTQGTSTTSGNETKTDYTVTVTSDEQSVVDGKIETEEKKFEGTFTVVDTDTKYTAEQTTVEGADYGEGSTTFTVSEMDGEKVGEAVGAATLVAGENVKITKGEDGSAIISAKAGGMTEISFNGDNKDAQIDNPKVLNIEGGATGELTEGNIGVISDGKDTLTVKLAKDITDVDNITVNKTVNVGDKITVGDTIVEGDQITTKTVNTDTVNLGDTTIEEGDDNHITYKKGGNTYNIATVEDGMDYAGDDGKAIHKNLAEQLDIVGGAADKASEYNIYTYNDGDKLRINLAKDIKGVDSVTVNKTVKVGDKTTIEGDQITTNTVNGDTINTKTINLGDTTIEEGDDNHITYKKGGNTYNIATVEDGMDYAGDDGKAIHKNLAEQLDIVGGAADKASEYNIYTYNDGDKLRINLAKDIKGVDSVTVNKTVKVGDKTTIEGDKITVGDTVIEGDQITTKTVKAGDTTINNDGFTIKNGPSITKNGIDVGGKKITNVAPGTDGTDAVNVNQLREANQDIYNSMNRLDNSTRKGIAGAAALAALHPLDFDPDDKWEFSAGVGNYRGETAAAIGAFYHPNDDTIFSLGATVGNGENLVNGGVTFRFGQQNHQSRSKKAMAKEIVELRAEVAELKAMVYSMANGRMPGLDLTKSEEFPDTPENHWAYDYVSVLAGNGVLEGYQDGFFKGDRTLTRYEMAAIIYRAMMRGVDVDERMKEEFAPELARVKVDTLTSHSDGTPSIQRVRVIKGRE